MVAREIAIACGQFDTIAYLDDNNPAAIGRLYEYEQFVHEYSSAVVAIGNAQLRLKLLDLLEQCGFVIPVLRHPAGYVSASAVIGRGSFLEPMAVVHTAAEIGRGCIISAGTIINHNSRIGEGCHLNCGTIVASGSVVQSQTTTQYGTRIL